MLKSELTARLASLRSHILKGRFQSAALDIGEIADDVDAAAFAEIPDDQPDDDSPRAAYSLSYYREELGRVSISLDASGNHFDDQRFQIESELKAALVRLHANPMGVSGSVLIPAVG